MRTIADIPAPGFTLVTPKIAAIAKRTENIMIQLRTSQGGLIEGPTDGKLWNFDTRGNGEIVAVRRIG